MSSVFYDFVLLLFQCVHLVFVLLLLLLLLFRLVSLFSFVLLKAKKSYVNSGILYVIDLS